MILNIIYLLKNSLIGRGNLSKRRGGRVYEALSPKFDSVYKIFLLHTSWAHGMLFCPPLLRQVCNHQVYMETILGNKNRYEMSIRLVQIGPNALDWLIFSDRLFSPICAGALSGLSNQQRATGTELRNTLWVYKRPIILFQVGSSVLIRKIRKILKVT